MSWDYSENVLVQNSAGNVLEQKLGWDVVFAYNQEILGEDGTLGRKSYKEIVLTRYLKKALYDNKQTVTNIAITTYTTKIVFKIAFFIFFTFLSNSR